MNAAAILRSLGPIDLRTFGRDRMLLWMVGLPILSAFFVRWGVPALSGWLIRRFGFDLAPYYPIIVGYFVVVVSPVIFGTLIGFMLLDEKDDHTLTALQVTPLSLTDYVGYRLAVPVALSIALLFVVLPISGLGQIGFTPLLITSLTAAPLAPLIALFLAAFAQNKVQGFALGKLAGIPLMIPVFAWFVDSRWELAFGLLPTYWPMKVYWILEAAQRPVWPYVLTGIIYLSVLTLLLTRRFSRVMHR